MSEVLSFGPAFVDEVPDELLDGVLYVSIEHASMIHLCACGCGSEVVLPLTPEDWRLTCDGENVSVSPSVGNWSLPCRSHYFIRAGEVVWAGDWSEERILDGRNADLARKAVRYGDGVDAGREDADHATALGGHAEHDRRSGFVGWFRDLVARLRGG